MTKTKKSTGGQYEKVFFVVDSERNMLFYFLFFTYFLCHRAPDGLWDIDSVNGLRRRWFAGFL